MRLIGLAVILAVSLTLAPLAVEAQPSPKMWRIGFLAPAEISRALLTEALRDLGYVEGRTFTLEVRTAENDLNRLPHLAAELVSANVDVIVAVSPPAVRAASQATKTIPIVMRFWGGEGLIESGIVASFARPSRNVTGIYMLAASWTPSGFSCSWRPCPTLRRSRYSTPASAGGRLRKFAESPRPRRSIST